MDKNIIRQRLAKTFVSEEVVPGISVTNAAKKKSAEENKAGLKDIEKKVGEFEKAVKEDPNAKQMAPNKFNYDSESEKTYHDQMEIMNGQEMIKYSSDPDKRFKERALEAIEGSSNMGNNPEWANVYPKQQGFAGPEFGKNLVKNIKASTKKRNEADKGLYSFGDDIENETRPNLTNTRFSALSENKDNNKTKIKESMKRLKFKNPFNGVGNALKLIPEGYRVDNKVFEMTDGNEAYKIRWEGNLLEGKAVVLTAADKSLVNEDITRMKQLFGYKSHETLGTLKGKERLDENKMFGDIWNKTKSLMETEDMEGADAGEGNWDEETKKAPEATKHVEGSTKKDATIAKGKEGNPDKAVKQAPEAKTPFKSSKGANIESEADVTEGTWEDAAKAQAPEAKKHVHLKESNINPLVVDELKAEIAQAKAAGDTNRAELLTNKLFSLTGGTGLGKGQVAKNQSVTEQEGDEHEVSLKDLDDKEEQEESWMKSEEFNIEAAEFMNVDGEDELEDELEDDELEVDDSNWAKSDDDDDSGEKEPEIFDTETDVPTNVEDDEDDIEAISTPSIDGMDFKLLSNNKGEFQIMVKGETVDVPNDEVYSSIAMDKTIKAADRAERIYDEMKKYGDI